LFPRRAETRRGSALIIALWVIMILSMLIVQFAFDMRIEGTVASHYRKLIKAQALARAGVEWTKVMLAKEVEETADGELLLEKGDNEQMAIAAVNLKKGVGIRSLEQELGEGRFVVDILPEEGRRNVNLLSDEDWEEVLDQGNVPEDLWPELIDCFHDWIDPDDAHRLNGAESDDSYYKQRDYECKDGPLDTVDELLLIKGFTEGILYGEPGEDGEEGLVGIAPWLTTWGDGKVNVNTASKEVLLTIPGIESFVVDDIIKYRSGQDGEMGTKDDGFESIEDVAAKTGLNPSLKDRITTTERKYIRVVSIGEVQGVKSGIWCILQAGDASVIPVFWREEAMP
jgi:general secretion pathway protein K